MADTDTLNEQTGTGQNGSDGQQAGVEEYAGGETMQDEIAKLRADLARYKDSVTKLAKEAGDAKKALRSKQSAEEIAAEEQREKDEAVQKELEELRQEVAQAKLVKTVMAKLGTDEEASGKISDSLIGAKDVEAALAEIQRIWTAKEKALRLEFGKIPPPGAGGRGGDDEKTQRAVKLAKEIGQERAANGKSLKEALSAYVR